MWKLFLRFVPSRIICGLATLGPIGYWGKAPGTNGTICGLLWYAAVFHELQRSPLFFAIALLVSIAFAIGICEEAEVRLQAKDPGYVILDEFVAIPICFYGFPLLQEKLAPWMILLLGFGLFRFYDILKPLGIKKLQTIPGGKGVVVDDLAAAFATCVTLHLIAYFL